MSFESPLVTRLSSSGSVSSPLRKNTRAVIDDELNDDDAERREFRRKSIAPEATSTPALPAPDRRKSNLGACSGLSSEQLSEHYANCIKLSTENKITVKNAFSLQLIDYMTMMLRRHDKQMEDFQVASCTLDASTKIYSFRVDAVHSDVVQMATSMGRTESKHKQKHAENVEEAADGMEVDQDDDDENQPQSTALKKLKKKTKKPKNTVAVNPATLLRKKKTSRITNAFLVHLTADLAISQPGDCPFHHAFSYFDSSQRNIDGGDDKPENSEGNILSNLPVISNDKDKPVCPSFEGFKFLGWKPEDELNISGITPLPPPAASQPNFEDHAFDMNNTPEPIPDNDNGAEGFADYGGVESDEEEEILTGVAVAASRPARQPVHVVDLQKHLSRVPLEYSYFQQSVIPQLIGPSHWKFKPFRKDKETDIALNKEAKKRTKKSLNLDYINTKSDEGFTTRVGKLNKKTIQNWSAERITMPERIFFDITKFTCSLSRCFSREEVPLIIGKDDKAPEVDDAVGDYAYDNPMDQESFCPNIREDDDDNREDMGDAINPDDDEGCATPDNMDVCTAAEEGAFVGDNLIAAPNKVAKMFIPYQMRAKKMDMKKLKAAMWEILTDPSDADKENQTASNLQEVEPEKRQLKNATSFKDLYRILPSKLPSKSAENLSCPLAFVGLLHLANEKCLDIKDTEEFTNLTIKQG